LLLPGPLDRVGHHRPDLHAAPQQADRGLHHRTVRMNDSPLSNKGRGGQEGAMSKHLERDLNNLQRDILAMGTAVEEAVAKAISALQDRDAELAREVIDGDAEID